MRFGKCLPSNAARPRHALHVGEQQREIIPSFRGDGHCFFHADSLPESLNCVQIYANREIRFSL